MTSARPIPTTCGGARRARADRGARGSRGRRAFTLVEMLVVIAIIMVLLSLLIFGLNVATKTAQTSNTRSLMQTIRQGLGQFRQDIGYHPPVLGAFAVDEPDDLRALWAPPALDDSGYMQAIQDWSSVTSLAEYLIGYGNHNEDGYGFIVPDGGGDPLYPDETPASGIRHPGPDGVWNASRGNGALEDRAPLTPVEGGPGTVYGPYIELDDPRLLASTDGTFDRDDKLRLYFPGDDGFDPRHPRVIVDYWGEPITYFRRNYPRGAIGQSYRAGIAYTGDRSVDERGVPSLADVVRLRPYTVDPGAAIDVDAFFADRLGDTTATVALKSAEFALFSPGPDRAYDRPESGEPPARVDAEEYNRDNIVEVGP